MCKLLMVLEADDLARPPSVLRALAGRARTEDAEVRLRTLTDVRLRDIDWADHLALGVRARGGHVPAAVKAWVDGLGFTGWRVFRDKPGCVIPIARHDPADPDAPPAGRAVVHFLAARGMPAVSAGGAELRGVEPRTDGTEPGYRLGAALARAHQPVGIEDARAGNC